MDDKLRQLLSEQYDIVGENATIRLNHDEAIAQIHQVLKDEGYVQVPKEVQETWREYNRMAGFMTGQSWYDRFVVELNSIPYSPLRYHEIMEAAKKAAGS